jgi:Uma2 family endonuclease
MISLEEYLQTSYKPDCDFVDDHIEERNVGKFEHSRVQALLAAWFVGHEKLWGFIVATEQRTRVSPTRVRIPDVCLIYAGAPREEITETPQLLCIEILSPDDRISRTTKVLEDFAAMGVEHLWIIDPIDRVGYIYQPGGKLQLVTDRLTVPETPIYLDLPDLFAALDPTAPLSKFENAQ